MVSKAYLPSYRFNNDYDARRLISGLYTLGVPMIDVLKIADIPKDDSDYLVVGDVNMIREWRQLFGIKDHFVGDYPEQFNGYYGRKISTTTIDEVLKRQSGRVFLKPKHKGVFVPGVYDFSSPHAAYGLMHVNEGTEIYEQEIINILAEWRVFILDGKVIDVRRYAGPWQASIDSRFIGKVASVDIGHQSYCLDVGLSMLGYEIVIEVNKATSFGSYGLFPDQYAKMHCSYWNEIWDSVAALDNPCHFHDIYTNH